MDKMYDVSFLISKIISIGKLLRSNPLQDIVIGKKKSRLGNNMGKAL